MMRSSAFRGCRVNMRQCCRAYQVALWLSLVCAPCRSGVFACSTWNSGESSLNPLPSFPCRCLGVRTNTQKRSNKYHFMLVFTTAYVNVFPVARRNTNQTKNENEKIHHQPVRRLRQIPQWQSPTRNESSPPQLPRQTGIRRI